MSSTTRPSGSGGRFAHGSGLLIAFVAVAAIGGVIAAGLALPAVAVANVTTNLTTQAFDQLPTDLSQAALPEKSTILAADGTQLATVYFQNRIVDDLSEISPYLQQAVISTEDKRFYEHSGVDVQGMGRAFVLSLLKSGSTQQGASTITQQYVKNVLVQEAINSGSAQEQQAAVKAATEASGVQGYARKLREAKLALTLETKESKDQILESYLNIAPFGASVYGAEAAANYYFSKSAKDLTYLEAATIAGITQNPTKWDPTRNPTQSQSRRDTVLGHMRDQGFITDAQYTAGIATKLSDTLHVGTLKQGCASATDKVAGSSYFCDYVTKVIKNDSAFGATVAERQALLYRGGLTIYTSLDPKAQVIANKAVQSVVPIGDPSHVIQAMSVVEPGTGLIKAMAQNTIYDVSGATAGHTVSNFNTGYAYGGSQGFQPGSTFKLFTLQTWLQAGHSLNESVNGNAVTYYLPSFKSPCQTQGRTEWKPQNSEGENSGYMSVLDATRNSVNRAYIAMAYQLDLCTIMQNAANLGIVQQKSGANFQALPGNILGSNSTNPLAIAAAYATFADGGIYCKPIAITRVVDTNDKDLTVPTADCSQKVDTATANTIAYAFTKVWSGTAKAVSPKPTMPAAGKTGTSNANEHLWFAGFTPRMAAAVVTADPRKLTKLEGNIGYAKHPPRSVYFGADLSGPPWTTFMNEYLNDGQTNPDFPSADDKLLNGDYVSVPSVIGSSPSVATSTLKDAGFNVVISSSTIASVQAVGTVASQSARKALPGATIRLTLSGGPAAPAAPAATAAPNPDPTAASYIISDDPSDLTDLLGLGDG